MSKTLPDVLNVHLSRRGWGSKMLSKASGVPANTINGWRNVPDQKIRHWQDPVRLATALELSRFETTELLEAGGLPSLEVLERTVKNADDLKLLAHWPKGGIGNMPTPLTSFVGRRQQLHHLVKLVREHRLITLTGTAGSGKTRLAVEVAQTVFDQFAASYFVDLSSVTDPDLIIPAISEALNLGESPNVTPMESLITYLRGRHILLVLDNFEYVIEAGPEVARMLESAPLVNAIVTSRIRLHVTGERVEPVLPLDLPELNATVDDIGRSPAIRLFVDRAHAQNPTFELAPANAKYAAEICNQLDGLPLAIELAAAKIRQFSLRTMCDRKLGGLELASEGPRGVHRKQQTMRAAIAWSYDLLASRDQRLYSALGVFATSFTQGSVGHFWGILGNDQTRVEVDLRSLFDQNLLQRVQDDDGGETRYRMLETMREFALERVRKSGLEGVYRAAHAETYLDMAERAERAGAGDAIWHRRLRAEHDNFRLALAWCREQHLDEIGLGISTAMIQHWMLRDLRLEAHVWLDTFMKADEEYAPELRAKGLMWQGYLTLRRHGETDAPERYFVEALGIFRQIGHLAGVSETLQGLGDLYRVIGRYDSAFQCSVESLTFAEQSGVPHLIADAWFGLALSAQEINFASSKLFWEKTLEFAARVGNSASSALALNSLGEVARHAGAWEAASDYYEQALVLALELGSGFRRALVTHNLGYVALYTGNPGEARAKFVKSLLLYESQQYRRGEAECLAGLARLETLTGNPERAARLCGVSEIILEGLQSRLDPLDRADYELTVAELRDRLGGDAFRTLRDEGRAMPIEQACTYATCELE